MSQTIVSVFVILLSQILPKVGVEVGSDQLTTTVSTVITIIATLWIWIRRVNKNTDVNAIGKKV